MVGRAQVGAERCGAAVVVQLGREHAGGGPAAAQPLAAQHRGAHAVVAPRQRVGRGDDAQRAVAEVIGRVEAVGGAETKIDAADVEPDLGGGVLPADGGLAQAVDGVRPARLAGIEVVEPVRQHGAPLLAQARCPVQVERGASGRLVAQTVAAAGMADRALDEQAQLAGRGRRVGGRCTLEREGVELVGGSAGTGGAEGGPETGEARSAAAGWAWGQSPWKRGRWSRWNHVAGMSRAAKSDSRTMVTACGFRPSMITVSVGRCAPSCAW
jgi:hypothetical protein